MSELTLTVIRLGFLAVLWLFVLTAVSVMRTDLFGTRAAGGRAASPVARGRGRPKPVEAHAEAPRRPDHAGRHRGHPRRHHASRSADGPHHARPGAGLHARAGRRLRLQPARPDLPQRRPVDRRGPRLHQRHLPRPATVTQPDAGSARRADPHRQDRPRAAEVAAWRSRCASPPARDVGLIREGNEDSGYAGPACSRSPTAWAATPPARSPAPWPSPTLAPLDDDVPAPTARRAGRRGPPGQRRISRHGRGATRSSTAWAPRSPRCCGPASALGLVHVGDSRAYLLRDGVLTQITQDHTFVQTLVDEGRITEEEADHPPAALPADARAGRPRRRRARPVDPRGRGRRPLPALLRRPVRRRLAPRRWRRPCAGDQTRRRPWTG